MSGGRFVPNETYMHDAAKRVVAQWFRQSQDERYHVRVGDVVARTNRGAPSHGVYLEYPIGTNGEGAYPCWDEVFDRSPPGQPLDLTDGIDWVPSVDFLKQHGIRTQCVCDVMLLNKGSASVAVEVIHKHPTPDWKIAFLDSQDIRLVEVKASAVLRRTKPPLELPLYVRRGRR